MCVKADEQSAEVAGQYSDLKYLKHNIMMTKSGFLLPLYNYIQWGQEYTKI